MPYPMSFCFEGNAAGVPSSQAATGPSISTSIYATHLGLASLIWSRNLFGLTLQACLQLTSAGDYGEDLPLDLQIRPWIFWKRRGSRRFHFKVGLGHCAVDVAWDLTSARFPSAGSPEPCSGFFVALSVDGEICLVAGNMGDEARRKMKAICISPAILISRRECVVLKGDVGKSTYRTGLRISGKEREIVIEVRGKQREPNRLFVSIDGTKVLQVRPLRWKFRGSEQVEIDGYVGRRILISWDLHPWFSHCKKNPSPSSAATFVFCFEGEEEDNWVSCGKAMEIPSGSRGVVPGYIGMGRSCSERSSISGGGDGSKGRKKILLKTISLSSSSSASSAASSSVTDWASPEEEEMRGVDGFSLVVHAWRT